MLCREKADKAVRQGDVVTGTRGERRLVVAIEGALRRKLEDGEEVFWTRDAICEAFNEKHRRGERGWDCLENLDDKRICVTTETALAPRRVLSLELVVTDELVVRSGRTVEYEADVELGEEMLGSGYGATPDAAEEAALVQALEGLAYRVNHNHEDGKLRAKVVPLAPVAPAVLRISTATPEQVSAFVAAADRALSELPACCRAPADAEPAHRLYAAYNAAGEKKGLNFAGAPCPTWDALPEDVRVKWRAAHAAASAMRGFPADWPVLP